MRKNTISVPQYLELKAKAGQSSEDKKAFDSYERNIKAHGCYSKNLDEMSQLIFVANNLKKVEEYVRIGEFVNRRECYKTQKGHKIREHELRRFHSFTRTLKAADMPTNTKALGRLLKLYKRNLKSAQTSERYSTRPVKAEISKIESQDTRTYKERYLDEVEKATNRAIELNLAANDKAWPSFISCEARVRCRQAAEAING